MLKYQRKEGKKMKENMFEKREYGRKMINAGIRSSWSRITKCKQIISLRKFGFVALVLFTYYAMAARLIEWFAPLSDNVYFSAMGIFSILFGMSTIAVWYLIRADYIGKFEKKIAIEKDDIKEMRNVLTQIKNEELREMGINV